MRHDRGKCSKCPCPGATMRVSEASYEGAWFALKREVLDQVVLARFTTYGEPVSKARMRFTKGGRGYTPARTRAAEEGIARAFREATNSTPDPSGAFGVVGIFFAATRQRRDVDNMMKLILDGLNGVAWVDDNQVLEVSARKEFVDEAEEARTEVLVYHLGPMPTRTGTCEHCGGPFPTYRSQAGRRFCSRACDQARRIEARRKTCPACGKSYVADRQRQEFCSRACSLDGRTVTEPCVTCGAAITRPISFQSATVAACSAECRAAYWVANPAKNAKGTCEKCGGPTSRKTYKRCRPCLWRLDDRTAHG